jgi:hypothetical protein
MKLVNTNKNRGHVYFIARLGPSPSASPYNGRVETSNILHNIMLFEFMKRARNTRCGYVIQVVP